MKKTIFFAFLLSAEIQTKSLVRAGQAFCVGVAFLDLKFTIETEQGARIYQDPKGA